MTRQTLWKRFFSILLSLCLISGLFPVRVSADYTSTGSLSVSQITQAIDLCYISKDTLEELGQLENLQNEDIRQLISAYAYGTYEITRQKLYYDSGIGSVYKTKFDIVNDFLDGYFAYSSSLSFYEADSTDAAASLANNYYDTTCSLFSYLSMEKKIIRENGATYIFEAPNGNEMALIVIAWADNTVLVFTAFDLPFNAFDYEDPRYTYNPDDYYDQILGLDIPELVLLKLLHCFDIQHEEKKSASCDHVLSQGYDYNGNFYELVENQEESVRGIKISVGVLKNNEWIYPLSYNFPYILEDGLFHYRSDFGPDAKDGSDYSGQLVKSIFFIPGENTAAFLMECSSSDNSSIWVDSIDSQIVFNCSTLKSHTINCGTNRDYDNKLLYSYREATFSDGCVLSYGTIMTDYDEFELLYSSTNDQATGNKNESYQVYSLDLNTFEYIPIISNTEWRPVGALLGGCFLCEHSLDYAFLDKDGDVAIDLSDYTITNIKSGCFMYGLYSFYAKGHAGSKWMLTIDDCGNVLQEVKISN